MSSLTKFAFSRVHLNRMCQLTSVMLSQTRNCGYIKDWKPSPRPKTKEEREAAAKKYHMIPEDYKPYDDGEGYGDYPHLPIIGGNARDPNEDFDWHHKRRNYGETLHIQADLYGIDRINPNQFYRVPMYTMLIQFLALMVGLCALIWVSELFDLNIYYPVKPKQYPRPGVVHYTFEPAHD